MPDIEHISLWDLLQITFVYIKKYCKFKWGLDDNKVN